MIGVLALQGAFAEHKKILDILGQRTVLVKKPSQLEATDGLIIPGGESTAISLLIDKYNFKKPLQKFVSHKPILATCAGLILLAKEVKDGKSCLPTLDITVRRNAYGRQVDSFEQQLSISVLGEKPFPGVFIRAPRIEEISSKADIPGPKVDVLAEVDNRAVAVRQGNIIGLTFHPELTNDTRFHQLFISMVRYGDSPQQDSRLPTHDSRLS